MTTPHIDELLRDLGASLPTILPTVPFVRTKGAVPRSVRRRRQPKDRQSTRLAWRHRQPGRRQRPLANASTSVRRAVYVVCRCRERSA